jgi:hypothetical protein
MEQELMSTCFNPDTMRKAKAKGIDAEKARATVRQVLDAAFREAPDRPPNHPAFVAEIEDRSPELKFYNYSESPPKMLSWVKGALQGL